MHGQFDLKRTAWYCRQAASQPAWRQLSWASAQDIFTGSNAEH